MTNAQCLMTKGAERRSTPAFAIGGDTAKRGEIIYVEESEEISAFVDHEQAALAAWDYRGPKCLALANRVLAAQGDAAEPELVQLQHDLAEMIEQQNLNHG